MSTSTVVISPPLLEALGSSREWWQEQTPYTASRVYRCILSGDHAGLDDAVLPISSFQYRLYLDGRTYISCIVPNAVLYAGTVADRVGGEIIIQQGWRYYDQSTQYADMARIAMESLRYDTGARSSSLTVVGSGTATFHFDPEVDKQITGVTMEALQADGTRKLRCDPVFGLFPGDVILYDGEYYLATYISVAVGRNMAQMEITYETGAVGTLYDLAVNTNTGISGW